MTHRFCPRFQQWTVVFSCSVSLLGGAVIGLTSHAAAGQTPSAARSAQRSSQVQVAYAEIPGEAPTKSGTVHRDTQVVPAGAHMLHKHPRVCPQGGCGPGGKCQGSCVVRPGRFGYYATQWRAWPGDRGVQQTSLQEMTPVSPPASAIPSVDEEALMPSSLMPEEDDASFGSDSFGFEREPIPSPQTPVLPPPGQPENGFGLPEGEIPSRPEESGAATPPPSSTPSLFDDDPAEKKPSLFDEPATPPQQPEASETPDAEEKPEDSIDNLFDDFGRASQMQGEQLRRRLAAVNQKVASRHALQQGAAGVAASMPGQLPSAKATPLVSRETRNERTSAVVPASVEQRTGVRSNPLR